MTAQSQKASSAWMGSGLCLATKWAAKPPFGFAQALLSILSTVLFWGWSLVAGIIALSWSGLTRIGEALRALRSQLVLPQDVENTNDFILLQINEPKTRFRSARHQVAKVNQPQLVKLIEVVFRDLRPTQKLWPFSGQTMRTRFQKLPEANKLDALPPPDSLGLDLCSLRAGGASWLMMRSEDAELTRRRGRWITNNVMEVYIQEVSNLQFMLNLPSQTKKIIVSGVEFFPWALARANALKRAMIPEVVWPILLRDDAVATALNRWETDGWMHTFAYSRPCVRWAEGIKEWPRVETLECNFETWWPLLKMPIPVQVQNPPSTSHSKVDAQFCLQQAVCVLSVEQKG